MTLRLRIALIVMLLFVAYKILHFIHKKIIDFKYALVWLFVDACVIVLTIFPFLLVKLSNLTGIANPTNMLFFFGFCLALVIIFSLSLSVSKLLDKVRKLSQEIAILRKDMYENCKQMKKYKSED